MGLESVEEGQAWLRQCEDNAKNLQVSSLFISTTKLHN